MDKSVVCLHETLSCINHYEIIRKYRCSTCGLVMICDCERELATRFLPHQIDKAVAFDTQARILVDGFASKICAQCRGDDESPHPLAAIWGRKGKVERFYWREIFKTYCDYVLDHYGQERPFTSIVDHDEKYPLIAKQLQTKAKAHWITIHRRNPKYPTRERTEAKFLSGIRIHTHTLEAPYCQVEEHGSKIGKWLDTSNRPLSVEDFVAQHYFELGHKILRCERRLITVWVATFLGVPLQAASDPLSQVCLRNSTKGWTPKNPNTPQIAFRIPRDFGTAAYFSRCKDTLETWFQGMLLARRLTSLYDALLNDTDLIRDYLWAAEDEHVSLGREALQILPKKTVISCVRWAIGDFWKRQAGWPDFLVVKGRSFWFGEVKSPNDTLSEPQMAWFEWAQSVASVPCKIIRVKRRQ